MTLVTYVPQFHNGAVEPSSRTFIVHGASVAVIFYNSLMARPNWHKVADQLARELIQHRYCRYGDCEVGQCSGCDAQRAYLTYVEAGGTIRQMHDNTIIDIRKDSQ